MAVSEQTSATAWLEAQSKLKALTERLRDCARNEQWDQVRALSTEQAQLARQVGQQVPPGAIEALGEAGVASLINSIAEANGEAISRMEAWQRSIGESIRQMENVHSNVSRLTKAYR